MKYKLLKELPMAKVGTLVILEKENEGLFYIKEEDDCAVGYILSKDIPEWLEEVKEPKTIYDLKGGDMYWYLNEYNEVNSKGFGGVWSDSATTKCFLTEREAKRNKLLRELATRTDKWLPEKGDQYYSYHLAGCDVWSWQGDNTDMIKYHYGLVFRNREEYSRWLTEYAKDLLFNI